MTYRLQGLASAREWTLEELKALLPAKEICVSFACSGNRRREINAVKPSIGVAYGPGAIQTGVFKGVGLLELLKESGLDE
jgi:nitrate reductase (NAD(P)H)